MRGALKRGSAILTITMTRVAILCFFALAFPAAAEEAEEAAVPAIAIEGDNLMIVIEPESKKKQPLVSGSIQTLMGVFFGTMKEYVFEKGYEHELSRLDWEENFVPYIGIAPELNIGNFFLNLSLITAIPVQGGYMRDYDYLNNQNTELTHFSRHDSMLEKHYEIFPSAGWTFKIGSAFSLSPYAGFTYRSRKWNALNGYLQYPAGSEPDPVWGSVITYEESTWFPSVGLIAKYEFAERFTVGIRGAFYPYFDVQTIDTHIARALLFYDTMNMKNIKTNDDGNLGGFCGLEFRYKPVRLKGLTFRFEAGYEVLSSRKGTTASATPGGNPKIDELYQSKMESGLWRISLGMSVFPSVLWQ